MITDYLATFADATSVGTPNNSYANVGNIIDLQAATANLGDGRPLYLVVQVTTAITSGGAATVSFALVSDSTTTISATTQSIHFESAVIAKASLVAGYQIITPVPLDGNVPYERYLAFQVHENAGQALNGGAVNAFLTLDPQSWKAYPNAI